MTVLLRKGEPLTRRRLLTGFASTAAIATGIGKPFISRAADRPMITHGVQSGDVSIGSGVVWARADRPARMLVEVSTTDSFKIIRDTVYIDALPETDFTAKALLEGLPPGRTFLPHFVPGSRITEHYRREVRSAISAPPRTTGVPFRFSGRAIRRGRAGASTKRAANATSRRC